MADEHVTPPEFQEFEKLYPDKDISRRDEILDRLFNFFSDEKIQEYIMQINWDEVQYFPYNLENIKESIIQLLSDAGPLVYTRRLKFMLLALDFMAYNVMKVRRGSGLRDTCNELGKLGCNIISLIKKIHPQVHSDPQKYKKVVTSMLSCIFACLQHSHRLGQQVESHQNLLSCIDSFSTESLVKLVDKHEKIEVPDSWFTDPKPVGLGREILEKVAKLVDIDSDSKFSGMNIFGQRGMGKSTLAKRIIKYMCHTSSSSTEKKSSIPFSCFAHLDFGNKEFSEEHMARMKEDMMKQILGVNIYVFGHGNDGWNNMQWILSNISSSSILIFLDNVRERWQVYPLIQDIDVQSLKSKLRIIITSQEPILLVDIEEHVLDKLNIAQSMRLFKKSILRKEYDCNLSNDSKSDSEYEIEMEIKNEHSESEIPEEFWGEERLMKKVTQLCDGIPGIIVSIAHHLNNNRTAKAYENVIQSLKKADMSRFKCHYASNLSLSDIILSIYNLLSVSLQFPLEDVCLLFDNWDWDMLHCLIRSDLLNRLEHLTMIKKTADGRVEIHNKILKSLIVNKVQNRKERINLVVDAVSIHKSTSLNLAESHTALNHVEGLFLKRRIHPIMDIMPSLDPFSKSLQLLHMESGVKIKFDSQTTMFNQLKYLNIQWNSCYDSKFHLASWMFPKLRVLSTSKLTFQDFNSLSNLEWLELDSVITMCDFSRCISVLGSLKVLRLFNCDNLTNMTFDSKNLRELKKIHIISCSNLRSISFYFPNPCYQHLPLEIKIINCNQLITLNGNFWNLKSLTILEISVCENLTFYKSHEIDNKSIQKICLEKVKNIKFLDNCVNLQYLVELHLSSIPNVGGLFATLQNLTRLQILSIKDCNKIQTLIGDLELSSLKTLNITSCSNLESLSIKYKCFSSLEELSIRDCENLKNLPTDLEDLVSLKKMAITSCKNITSLPKELKKLKALQILDLSLCKNIKQLNFSTSFEQVKKLSLIACRSLESFPTGFQGLTSLQELDMSRCDAIEELSNMSPSLKLWKLCSCKKLKSLPSNLQNLTSLKMLDLRDCKNLDKFTLPISLNVLNMSSSKNIPQKLDALESLKDLDLGSSDILIKKNKLKDSQYLKTAHFNTIEGIESMLV